MLTRYGASARSARARRTYDAIMTDTSFRNMTVGGITYP